MKKILAAAVVTISALCMTSCSSIFHTAKTVPVETEIVSKSTADLQVSQQKISYKYYPNKAVRRCGEKSVIKTAVAAALAENGNADVLVGFQYEIKKSTNIFGCTKISYVIVEGYPAKYVNVQAVK